MDENKKANDGWFQLSEMKPLIRKTPIKRVETTSTEAKRAAKHKQTKKVGKKDEGIDSQRKVKSIASSESQSVLKNSGVKEVLPTSEKREEVLNVEKGQTIKETKKGKAQERKNASKYKEDMPAELHSQTIGKRGPVLEQDSVMHETLETFIHEKILERPVHVKGFGAFGYFETTHSMSDYTKLSFLQQPGEQVPVAVRFSLAVSTKGTPDTSRNVRGFSTKFYTNDGVFDLVFNHIPVFSVRDAIRFPEAIKAFLPSPKNNLIDPERFWNFVARAPESTHFVVRLYSNAGTVKSLRHISGHSVNTYVWRNTEGKRHYVKYRWVPLAGEEFIDAKEATKLAGENPDIAGQDLYNTIAVGKSVQYDLYVQVMNPSDEEKLSYDPLDDTKVWSEHQYPLRPVGRMVLNQNPDHFMEEVEKIAFSPSNLLDGAELSDDKMLQGRANIYSDSQRRRIGPEFRKVPVNQQVNWTPANLVTSGNDRYVEGTLQRSDIPKKDDFTQAGEYYDSLTMTERDDLVQNLAADLAAISIDTRSIVLTYLTNASHELATRVKHAIVMEEEKA